MNGAVVITEWYVVPEEVAPARPMLVARPASGKSAAGLGAATAGSLWAWSDAAGSPRWHGTRPPRASGASYLVEVPRPAAMPAHRALAPTGKSAPVVLPMAPAVLRAMAQVAAETGRAESDLWAEAAREWLARHQQDDPEPPTPGASAPARRAEREARPRCWAAIDVLLRDLRAPLPDTEDEPAA